MQICKEEKPMPFIQLAGDQPVYVLINVVKNENQKKISKILLVVGGFLTHRAFMAAMYIRFKGSSLEDFAASAGIAEVSIEQALKGKPCVQWIEKRMD